MTTETQILEACKRYEILDLQFVSLDHKYFTFTVFDMDEQQDAEFKLRLDDICLELTGRSSHNSVEVEVAAKPEPGEDPRLATKWVKLTISDFVYETLGNGEYLTAEDKAEQKQILLKAIQSLIEK